MGNVINNTKAAMDNVLQSVLAIAQQDQNMSYPPFIFQNHYNIVVSFILDSAIKIYPNSPFLIDVIDGYVSVAMLPVKNGYIDLPPDYRNLLGSPYIFANPKQDGECGQIPDISTPQQFQVAQNKAQCKMNPVTIVSQAEFTEKTRSTFDYPTHEYPLGYFSGKKQIKICPYDLTVVGVLYAQQEQNYVYGYEIQPDDSYINDPTTTNDSLFGNSAFSYLVKGCTALYAAYSRDPELSNFSQVLSQASII